MPKTKHSTLTAATVATITLDAGGYTDLVVLNRSGSNPIYFTTDGTTPTVAGDDTYVVPAAAGASLAVKFDRNDTPDVKLISSGAEDYSVMAI